MSKEPNAWSAVHACVEGAKRAIASRTGLGASEHTFEVLKQEGKRAAADSDSDADGNPEAEFEDEDEDEDFANDTD